MGEHGPLRDPGRAARVGDDVEVVVAELGPGWHGLALGQRPLVVQRLPVTRPETEPERDVCLGDHGGEPGVDHDRRRRHVAQDVLHLGRLQAVVERYYHQTGLRAAEVHLPVAVARLGEDRHAVAVPQAARVQRGGEPAAAFVGLPPGEVGLGAAVGRVTRAGHRLAAHDLRQMHPVTLPSRRRLPPANTLAEHLNLVL